MFNDQPSRVPLFLLLAASLSLFFVDLGGSAIWDANEAFYVETPREMIERGDFVFPTFNYEPRVNKPILSYWIVAGFYKLFGVSVAVQRIPIAIGGVAIVAITFFLGRLTVASSHAATAAGLWAALGMAVSPRLVMFSRRILIDIYITVFMAATLLFFALAECYPHRRRLFLSLMYVAVGLGVLTKGPVAAALPGLVFLVYLLVHRELRRAKEMMIPWGVVVVLAIIVPWYAALYQRDGWTPIASFFLGENIGRFSEGVGHDTGRGPLFYIGVLFSDGFPWSILLFAAFAQFWHRAPGTEHQAHSTHRAPSTEHRARQRVSTLLWIWIATIVVFFSLSASKQDLYIYPVMPAVAALGAAVVVGSAPGARWLSALIGLLLAGAGAGILYVFQANGNVYELAGVALFGWVVIAGGVAALALSVAGRWRLGLVLFLAAGVLGNWILVLRVLPSFEKYKPVPPITAFLQTRATSDDVIAHYSVALPSMVFYMRRHIDITYDRETFIRIMQEPKRVFGVLWTEEYERLRGDLAVQTCVVHSTPSFNVKLGAVMKRETLPELVVITNRCD
ncbi:MAG TPA: glycosyltransferase family 39 protein [Vicinamibacterales bacterium]|nr:glycosyltransferase family 39 protein [Vicinamibacterales bacterium]